MKDVRHTKFDLKRRARFRKGYEHAVAGGAEYRTKQLTWQLDGFRQGKHHGPMSRADIDTLSLVRLNARREAAR